MYFCCVNEKGLLYALTDRHQMREYSFETPTCKKLSPRHRSYKETVELNKEQPAHLTIANHVPHLSPRDSNMQLHTLTFSSPRKASTCGQSSSTSNPVISSSSDSRTSLEEVIDRGSVMEEDNVFIDNNSKNGLQWVTKTNSSTFEMQCRSSIPTSTSHVYRNVAIGNDLTQFQENLNTHSPKETCV